jgi:hypothetical protein
MASMRLGGLEIIDLVVWLHGQGWARPHTRALETDEDVAASLKPAAVPIVLARAPLDGTVADTFADHGTGLLRLDRTRVGGRYPANLVLSHEQGCADDTCALHCPVAMLDAQSGRLKARGNVNPTRSGGGRGSSTPVKAVTADHGPGDAGGASRFFFCARASTSERNAGVTDGQSNPHPSVKPVAVMRWLIELLCPPGGVVLDPFLGSGTTAVAAAEAGVHCIGIDRDGDGLYLPVAAARARHAGAQVRLHNRSVRLAIESDGATEVADELRRAARRLRQADHRAEVLRAERDALLGRGRDAGFSWRELAALSGLSSPQAAERIGRQLPRQHDGPRRTSPTR